MTAWDEEQRAYRERKLSDGTEAAMLIAMCILVACLMAAGNVIFDAWVRPWLMR